MAVKKYLLLALILAAGTVLIPLAVRARTSPKAPAAPPEETTLAVPADDPDAIRVFFPEENAARELPLAEYIAGVVAGEMPAVYHEEALKAQAVAAVTLSRYLKEKGPIEGLDGAVVTADCSRHQAYLSEEALREKWGDDFETWYSRILSAVDEVLPYTITYAGEPILAVFHAVSAGKTQSAADVWGGDYPYLVSVDAEGDKLSPDYLRETPFPTAEFFEALGLQVPEDPENAVADARYTAAGYLKTVTVSGKTFTGTELRSRLGLRSSAAEIAWDGDGFLITTRGYGHGAGMSQYGADYYARQGMDWREIVAHFYPHTEISREN